VFVFVCTDELQALKDGNNNWDILREVSAASPGARCWGLTASVYNNTWEDVRIPAAWVTGNVTISCRTMSAHATAKPLTHWQNRMYCHIQWTVLPKDDTI